MLAKLGSKDQEMLRSIKIFRKNKKIPKSIKRIYMDKNLAHFFCLFFFLRNVEIFAIIKIRRIKQK